MLLDEPTNHLDIEAIDSLAEAINNFKVRHASAAAPVHIAGLLYINGSFVLSLRASRVAHPMGVCAEHMQLPGASGSSGLGPCCDMPASAAIGCDLQGGMVLVSHDFRLIDQVAKEIWECNNKVRLCAPRVLLTDTNQHSHCA